MDPETGEYHVLKVASVFDVGKAINPEIVRGQCIGGMMQGLGTAICEGYIYDEQGHLLNPSFTDNKIPTARDLPDEIESIAVETPQLDGPYGARGVGEHPMISVAPALGNAIQARRRRRADAHADPLRGRLARDAEQGADRQLDHEDAERAPASREVRGVRGGGVTARTCSGCYGSKKCAGGGVGARGASLTRGDLRRRKFRRKCRRQSLAAFMHEPMTPAAQRDQVIRTVRSSLVARFGLPGLCPRASQASASSCAGARRCSPRLVVTAARSQSGYCRTAIRAACPVACGRPPPAAETRDSIVASTSPSLSAPGGTRPSLSAITTSASNRASRTPSGRWLMAVGGPATDRARVPKAG